MLPCKITLSSDVIFSHLASESLEITIVLYCNLTDIPENTSHVVSINKLGAVFIFVFLIYQCLDTYKYSSDILKYFDMLSTVKYLFTTIYFFK